MRRGIDPDVRLDQLPPRNDDGDVLVVVETPRDSRVKLKYEPKLGIIAISRPLALGLHYPFDWGFVPGTCAADGDPIDAMVLSDAKTFAGIAIPSKIVGVLRVEQTTKGKRVRNDRLIAIPVDAPRSDNLRDARKLPKRTRQELELFFLNAVAFTDKNPKLLGWSGPREATRLLEESIQSSSSSRPRRSKG